MKSNILILLMLVCLGSGCGDRSASQPERLPVPEPIIPSGSINIINMELPEFLPFYATITGAELDTNQLGKLQPFMIHFRNTNAVTRSEAIRLLDQVLFEQAGIIASHPDAKHVQLKYRSSANPGGADSQSGSCGTYEDPSFRQLINELNDHSGKARILTGSVPRQPVNVVPNGILYLRTAPPTGTYAAYLDPETAGRRAQAPLFTLHLETNGTYLAESSPKNAVQDGDLTRLRPEVARGTWHWDAERQEFRLEPGTFLFNIRHLTLDKQHPGRLLWGKSWLVPADAQHAPGK